MSKPPSAQFDLVDSYARRRGSDVEIVLADPAVVITESPIVVTLRCGRRSVEAKGEFGVGVSGAQLTIRAPRAEFGNGTWSLVLHPDAHTEESVAARLLVQGERPLVLLWGATSRPSLIPSRRSIRTKRAVAAGGKVLDKALTVLPEDKAKKVRAQVRSTARKVLH